MKNPTIAPLKLNIILTSMAKIATNPAITINNVVKIFEIIFFFEGLFIKFKNYVFVKKKRIGRTVMFW